jgi:hypothetical protein
MTDWELRPSAPWTCAACGRHVPGRVAECRCGAPAPALAVEEDDAGVASPVAAAPSRAMWWWAAPGLVGLGLIGGLFLARPSVPRPEPAAAQVRTAPSDPVPETVDILDEDVIGESATTLTTEVPFAPAPDGPAVDPAPAVAAGRTVEDLVAAAIAGS